MSNNFLSQMKKEALENFNESVTENGALGYRTTGKNLLDLNFSVASLRSAKERDIIDRFMLSFFEDKVLALKWLFFARDIREGLGERRIFQKSIRFVAEQEPEIIKSLLFLIPEYGRFDDLWVFLDIPTILPEVVKLVRTQLDMDIEGMKNRNPISLLAKWMPSLNTSSSKTRKNANILRKQLNLKEFQYRKMLSGLRSYIDVVEVKMSKNQWNKIDYETVPSRANLIYNKAFFRNDEIRRQEYISKLKTGEAKINSSTLYPHEIVHKYGRSYYDETLEALWSSLPDTVGGAENILVVADGSGSMTVPVGDSSVSALSVANALAIYFSERCSGEFKDKYVTFSNRPQIVDFGKAKSLLDKIRITRYHTEVSNTNIEAVFDLILQTAIKNEMNQEDIPATVLIISDMEFDNCSETNTGQRVEKNLFSYIKEKYEIEGFVLPRLVFWNVNSRTGTIPVKENNMGVALVSGFSVNICKMVMSGKVDPLDNLLETLNSKRYDIIKDSLISLEL